MLLQRNVMVYWTRHVSRLDCAVGGESFTPSGEDDSTRLFFNFICLTAQVWPVDVDYLTILPSSCDLFFGLLSQTRAP